MDYVLDSNEAEAVVGAGIRLAVVEMRGLARSRLAGWWVMVVVASLVAVLLPLVKAAPAAEALTVQSGGDAGPSPRICSGDTVHGSGRSGYGTIYVPKGWSVRTSGSATFAPDFRGVDFEVWGDTATGGHHSLWGVQLLNADDTAQVLGQTDRGPFYDDADFTIWLDNFQAAIRDASITVTLIDPNGIPTSSPVCPNQQVPGESNGCNTAEANASKSHGTACDPVDTATGNFHQGFDDLVVPHRAEMTLSRGYNSLSAGASQANAALGWDASGPMGYGWSYSFGSHLMFDSSTGIVTVVQEGGATVPFFAYPDSNAFYTANRVNATLSRDPSSGLYSFTRRGSDSFVFDSSGRLLSRTDRFGYTTTVNYDSSNHVSSVVDAAGRSLSFTWVGNHIDTVTDSGSPQRSVHYQYSAANDLYRVIDVAGNTWQFAYDANHRMTGLRTPNQFTASPPKDLITHYDSAGRVDYQVDQDNRRTDLDYTSVASSTLVTLPQMSSTDTRRFQRLDVYDPDTGARIAVTEGYGTAQAETWHLTVDPSLYAITKVTDQNQQTVFTATYDSRGNPMSVTDALGRNTHTSGYNTFNEPNDVTDAAGVTTALTYDAHGSLLTRSTPLLNGSGATIGTRLYQYNYDTTPGRAEDLLTYVDPNLKTWTLGSRDAYGNLTSLSAPATPENPVGNKTTWVFDSMGRIQSSVAPKGNQAGGTPSQYQSTYTVDPFLAVTSITDPLGQVSARHFDADHNVDWTQDPNQFGTSAKTQFTYDPADQLVATARPAGPPLQTAYFGNGAVASQTDAAGAATKYDYDPVGRLTKITDPNNKSTTFGYDVDDNLKWRQEQGGNCTATTPTKCTSYTYDAAGELKLVTHTDAATPNVTNIDYDPLGRRTTTTTSDGKSATSSWDSLGRLSTTTDGAQTGISYQYDLVGNLTQIVSPTLYPTGSHAVVRHYDDAGRFDSTTDYLGNTTTFAYDADSNQQQTTFPSASGNTDTNAFDRADALSGVTMAKGSTTSASVSYGRRANGDLQTMSSTGLPGASSESYGYNGLNQLCYVAGSGTGTCSAPPAGASTYTYDTADNITGLLDGRTQGFNPANQLCYTAPAGSAPGTCASVPDDATTYTYDTRGNRTATTPAGDVPSAFTYDQENRLTKAIVPTHDGHAGELNATNPTRLLDTRSGTRTGTCDGGSCATIQPGQSLTVQVTGQAGLPASGLEAIALNVTATSSTGGGYLTVYPSDKARPGTSNLNFVGSQTISNAAVVNVSADGKITVYNGSAPGMSGQSSPIDVLIDVEGWYASADGPPGGGTFKAVTPARVLDTRTPTGTCTTTCATIPGRGTLTVKLAGKGGLPATGMAAAALNATVTGTTSFGYLTMFASGTTQPATSNINFESGQTLAGFAVTQVGADGYVSIYNGSYAPVDVILDVFGWYATSAQTTGNDFDIVTPTRLFDTRPTAQGGLCSNTCNPVTAGGTLTVTAGGAGQVPADATAVMVNVTPTQPTSTGYLTLYASGTSKPATSNVNFETGQTVANTAIVKLSSSGQFKIYNGQAGGTTHVIVDVIGYFSPPRDTWTYTYDPNGLRATKAQTGGATTKFTWNQADPTPQLLAEDTNTKTLYIYGPGGLPIEQINPNTGNPTVLYLHHDQLGSTRTITTNTGTTIGTATYDAYGNTTATTGVTTHLGYTGQYTDPETGFIYLRARFYDPATGQFLTRDPLVAATRSAYAYVYDNPLNRTDPSGLDAKDFWSDPLGWAQQHKEGIVQALAVSAVALGAAGVVIGTGGLAGIGILGALSEAGVGTTFEAISLGMSIGVTYSDCRDGAAYRCAVEVTADVAGAGGLGLGEAGLAGALGDTHPLYYPSVVYSEAGATTYSLGIGGGATIIPSTGTEQTQGGLPGHGTNCPG